MMDIAFITTPTHARLSINLTLESVQEIRTYYQKAGFDIVSEGEVSHQKT